MVPSGRVADRLIWAVLYVGVFAMTLWGGAAALNYSLDSRFHREYVAKWAAAARMFDQANGRWPVFSGDQIAYMDALSAAMKSRGVTPPRSNTRRPYIYLLKKWGRDNETVMILCRPARLYLYGLSEQTFGRLDEFIDDGGGPTAGSFVGRPLADGSYIGQWNI